MKATITASRGVKLPRTKSGKRSKYRNVRTEIEGILFHSKKEANRYLELHAMEKRGKIHSLQTQRTFALGVNGVGVCKYIADFTYWEVLKRGSEVYVVEDVKGYRTAVYKLKLKLMKAIHGIDVKEV